MAKSKEELLNILRNNREAFNKYREETNNEHLDLSGADLTGSNLCRANLDNINLRDTELNFAYMHSAIITNSDLTDLTVGRADMTEANLSNSIMDNADLTNTILYGANLSGVKASFIILEGAKLREVNFSGADLSNGNLSQLDLNGANFDKAILKSTNFTGSNLSGALNLNTAIFDATTMWSNDLPDDFDPTSTTQLDFIEEADSELNTDFGPGLAGATQEYEFLDMPSKREEPEMPIGHATTEFGSPYNDEEELTEDEFGPPPSFEQFTAAQFLDTPGIPEEPGFVEGPEPGFAEGPEPGFAEGPEPGFIPGPDFDQELGGLGELPESTFADDFSSMVGQAQQEAAGFGSISSQGYPVQDVSLEPTPEGIPQKLHEEPPIQEEAPPPPPVIKKPEPVAKPKAQPAKDIAISEDQLQPVLRLLTGISKKLEKIEAEQENQKNIINELKKNTDDKHLSTIISDKVENLTASTTTLFSRIESKVDIIAQTDPLEQMDSLLGELADSIRTEQENLEGKIINLSTVLDSTVSLIEAEALSQSDVDFTSLTNNIHQMLTNLESNVREDQDNVNHKIEDLATIIEGLSVVLENVETDIKEETSKKINSLSENLSTVGNGVNNIDANIQEFGASVININNNTTEIQDTVNNINNTVGTLIELSQDNTAESQIYEAFYDFEFRLQLELEKSHGKLNQIEELFEKTNDKLEKLQEKTTGLDKISKLENIPKLLETFRNQLFTEIQQTEQRTNRLREVVDDMVIQLEALFNMQISRLQHSLESDISSIHKKIDTLIDGDASKIDDIRSGLSSIQSNFNNIQSEITSVQGEIKTSNNFMATNISSISNKIGLLEEKLDLMSKDSKVDDELRSVLEHLLVQFGEQSQLNQENSNIISKKFEDFEVELQMTLKDMDRRISKVNSMIRNVYKGIDSISDLITENKRPSRTTLSSSDKPRKTLATKISDLDSNTDDDDDT